MEVDHLGIAVHRLAEAIPRWVPVIGPQAPGSEEVPTQRVKVAFAQVGATHLEFLEPTGPDSPVARFLERQGEGFHHLALRVESVDATLERLAAEGRRTVDRTGRPGARGRRVGFAHPSAFGGVLVEFVEGG